MVLGRRGLHEEGGVDEVEGAQEDREKKVDAIREEIWDVRSGGV